MGLEFGAGVAAGFGAEVGARVGANVAGDIAGHVDEDVAADVAVVLAVVSTVPVAADGVGVERGVHGSRCMLSQLPARVGQAFFAVVGRSCLLSSGRKRGRVLASSLLLRAS